MTKSTPPRFGDRRVGIGLERHLAAAAQAFVGGDDDFRLAILDAAGERIRREAAEHHGMDGADARAGQHGVGRFRDHRQVDGDAIAFLDVAVAQNVGEAADLVVQLLIGDVLGIFRIVAFPDDGGLVASGVQMAVDAVVGDVGGAVLEPFDRDVVFGERGVLDLGEMLHPVDALGLLGPKAVGIGERACVHFLVFGLVDEGALGPLGGNFVDLIRHTVLHCGATCARISSNLRPLSAPLARRTSGPRSLAECATGLRCALNSWFGNADASGVLITT